MISALILAFPPRLEIPSPEAVVRTLAAIVPAAVENVVCDVALIGPAAEAAMRVDLSAIADHAGCSLFLADSEGEGLRAGLTATRREIALILRAGYAPRQGFVAELADFAGRGSLGPERAAALRVERKGIRETLALRAPLAGLLAQRAALLSRNFKDFDDLVRRIKPSVRFRCGAFRVV
jgi:hypothetical protein